jgi:hypothetical protein
MDASTRDAAAPLSDAAAAAAADADAAAERQAPSAGGDGAEAPLRSLTAQAGPAATWLLIMMTQSMVEIGAS